MRSYDLLIHKEIVRLLKEKNIDVRDNIVEDNNPVVLISESSENPDITKTFNRNEVNFTIKMWGSKNGSSLEVKQLKAIVLEALTEGVYKIPGYFINRIDVENVATFKETEGVSGNNKTSHYYQSILNIKYKIKGEM